MSKGKSDISNFAIRVFLQKVGSAYDVSRGREPFKPTTQQWKEVTSFFQNKCCYCLKELAVQNSTKDHLIPLNKESLGLHAWGNVVPCCAECNRAKHNKGWLAYLESICNKKDLEIRRTKIEDFLSYYKYMPDLNLHAIANNLYEDVGEVAMTLIDLRFKQATEIISTIVNMESS